MKIMNRKILSIYKMNAKRYLIFMFCCTRQAMAVEQYIHSEVKRLVLFLCIVFVCSALICIPGCKLIKKQAVISPKAALERLDVKKYPEFTDDILFKGIDEGILRSLSYLKKVPPERKFKFGTDSFNAAHMIKSLEAFLSLVRTNPSIEDLNNTIKSEYIVYQSVGSGEPGNVLFTGYYEPLLHGSYKKTGEYKFPVFARPDNLVTIDLSLFSSKYGGQKILGRYMDNTVVPYYDRKEIEQKNLIKDNAKELAWVNDRVDLFFLHIQGSGIIRLKNGETINIHYHTTNGRQYKSIGKLLVDQGKIPGTEMSMQAIRKYLDEHPKEVDDILYYNSSYIFFKLEKEGPIGLLGVKLTPGRSIALDKRLFPWAGLAFLETEKPLIDDAGHIHAWTDCRRFVLNHDTGGAIKGPGRADIFWGNGEYAEIAAGYMQHTGKLYFLVLQPDKLSVSSAEKNTIYNFPRYKQEKIYGT